MLFILDLLWLNASELDSRAEQGLNLWRSIKGENPNDPNDPT